MSEVLVAYYFAVLVPAQVWPVLVGPYETWQDCASVREYLDRRGYETGACDVLPVPQEAIWLEVIQIP